MNLPQHVVDQLERRWAAKLQQDVEAWWKRKRPRPTQQKGRLNLPVRALTELKRGSNRRASGSELSLQFRVHG
jgi:hypothetical protein